MTGAAWKILALVVGTVLVAPASSEAKSSADWSAVQSIRPGHRVRVRVLDSASPKGSRLLKGCVFVSATPESFSVLLKDGSTASLAKAEVLKVATRRRLSNRPRPLIHGATVSAGWMLFIVLAVGVGDVSTFGVAVGIPFGIAGYAISALVPGYQPVYASGAPERK